jgi:hypothetical protein
MPADYISTLHTIPDWRPYLQSFEQFIAQFPNSQVPSHLSEKIYTALQDVPQAAAIRQQLVQELASAPSYEEFTSRINNLKRNSSPGMSGLSYIMLRWKGPYLPDTVFSFFLSVILSLVISLSINSVWKISVHMLAQGGVFGTLLALNVIHPNLDTLYPALSVLMAGVTGYSRLYLDAHTHGQVYAGFCLGAVINWLIISQTVMI